LTIIVFFLSKIVLILFDTVDNMQHSGSFLGFIWTITGLEIKEVRGLCCIPYLNDSIVALDRMTFRWDPKISINFVKYAYSSQYSRRVRFYLYEVKMKFPSLRHKLTLTMVVDLQNASLVQRVLYTHYPASPIVIILIFYCTFVTARKPTLVYYCWVSATVYSDFTSSFLMSFLCSRILLKIPHLLVAVSS
jgi:hypothetical protein